jgi:hypothetical protein
MYRRAFPRCTVEGSLGPVPFSHLGLEGAVPAKCSTCSHLFEGECRRALEATQGHLALDHGPCPVAGPTQPVRVETPFYASKVFVPEKCRACRNLELDGVRGFLCTLDADRWGDFPRELDWGSWSPEHPLLGLQSGRSVPVDFVGAVRRDAEADAVRAFRQAYPTATFQEARDAFAELREKLAALEHGKGS